MSENKKPELTEAKARSTVEAGVMPKKLFGGGYRKPIKDETGYWCNCAIPNLVNSMGRGTAYCLRCHTDYYH
ncbi:MAG: hypothetical protein PHU86_03820 [Patescibacteria group bacterium]|nr:hypothetical protein [Patescibacteria group bacterium]